MPTVYRSDDVGGPGNLSTHVTGDYIRVLDAVLVNGYPGKPSAGWIKHSVSSGSVVYEPGLGGASKRYYRFDKTGTNIGYFRGYASLPDAIADNGSVGFPTSSQSASGLHFLNSGAFDSSWIVVADAYTVYASFFVNHFNFSAIPPASSAHHSVAFGQFKTYVPGDTNNWMIVGNARLGIGASLQGPAESFHYTHRNALNDPAPSNFHKVFVAGSGGPTSTGLGRSSSGYSYPDVHTGSIRIQSKVQVAESVGGSILLRGEMPGMACPISNIEPLVYGVLQGTGSLAGREWLVMPCSVNSSNPMSLLLFDLADWSH